MDTCSNDNSSSSSTRSNDRRRRPGRWRHRWGLASSKSTTTLTSLLLALTTFFANGGPKGAAGQQTNSTTPLPECSAAVASGASYAVSVPADAVELAAAVASCTGGAYNVTWTGAVTLDEPLVVAADSFLTIRGFQSAAGEAAALDGNNVTGLVDLGEGSSLRLEGVALRNARRASGNGGAVRAEEVGCVVVAIDAAFESNTAVGRGFEEGRGGALALGSGATAELENCTITGNRAQGSGGGVSIEGGDGTLVFKGCVLEDNASELEGGAVVLGGRSTVTFVGSTVSSNTALDGGGAVYGVNGTVVVGAGSRFVNNTVFRAGAGISLYVSFCLLIFMSCFCTDPGWLSLFVFCVGSFDGQLFYLRERAVVPRRSAVCSGVCARPVIYYRNHHLFVFFEGRASCGARARIVGFCGVFTGTALEGVLKFYFKFVYAFHKTNEKKPNLSFHTFFSCAGGCSVFCVVEHNSVALSAKKRPPT